MRTAIKRLTIGAALGYLLVWAINRVPTQTAHRAGELTGKLVANTIYGRQHG